MPQGDHGSWSQSMQAGRGDIKHVLLGALAEKPMHGYELIQHFAVKSHGHWRPSPGSVYPMLQRLEDEGLLASRQEKGKKIFTATEAGLTIAKQQLAPKPWEGVSHPERMAEFWPLMRNFMKTLRWLSINGSAADYDKTKQIVEEATAQLIALQQEHKEE